MATLLFSYMRRTQWFNDNEDVVIAKRMKGKAGWLAVFSLLVALCTAPLATCIAYFFYFLFTNNGHNHVALFRLAWFGPSPKPLTWLRKRVLVNQWDQNGIQAGCGGSFFDELLLDELALEGMFDFERPHLSSPTGWQTWLNTMAAVTEELDFRLLPWCIWSICGGSSSTYSRLVFLLGSALIFAAMHNINANSTWTRWDHLRVFLATFLMGLKSGLIVVDSAFAWYEKVLLCIAFHIFDNSLAMYHETMEARLWVRTMFPTPAYLSKARMTYQLFHLHWRSTHKHRFIVCHTYEWVRTFMLTHYLIPTMYHRRLPLPLPDKRTCNKKDKCE